MELQKLMIKIIDDNVYHYKYDNVNFNLKVMYNPTSVKYSKEIIWIDSGSRHSELRQKQYDMIKFKKLEMQLFFDFTMDNSNSFDYYFNFFELITSECVKIRKREKDKGGDSTRKSSNLYRPPILKLVWGNMIGIPHTEGRRRGGVYIVTNINWLYKMFDREGKVLRATVDITFEEIRRKGTGTESNKERRVSAGDRAIVNAIKSLKG